MESKTMLLDLVQQRKDGKISQEEMVRQLVELRNHSGGAAVEPAAAPTKASAPQSPPGEQGTVGGESLATAQQQRPVLEADIARQRQQRLAAKQFRGIVAAPRVEEPAGPATQYGQGRGAEEAAALARTFHAAVNSQGRDWRDVFNEYDLGKEGRLDFDDFRRGVRNDMSAAQSALTDLDLRRLFDMMDDSHSESVSAADFSNFLSSMSPQSNGRAEQQRRFTYPHNANTIALRDKFCAVAIGHDRSVDWKSLLERFSPDGDGYITFVEFSRAVRRDRKVTRAAMSDRELRQLFDIVDVRQRDKISAEGLEYFLQQPARALRKQQTKKQSCRNARPRADHSQGWDGTSEGSEISEFALSSQQSSLSGEPSFQKGPRVARKLKKQEDANCTFTPEIKELPSQYSKGNSVVADAPFSARAGQWLEKRKDKLNSERRLAKSRETAGCTFHPRLSPSTHAKQRQARSGRSREEKFERLYSEKLGRDEAKMKKAQQLEGRTDGGKWFKPKINDSASSQPDNYAKPVVRKVGAVTQQLLNERESQHTFTPKTNAVPSKFGCAAEYLSDNAFDRLSRPTRSDGMDDSAELSTGERLFDSVYDFGQEPQRTQRARPSSAPRLRTVPSHGDNASESDSVASSSFDEFYAKSQRWAAKKQEKLKQKAAAVVAEGSATSPVMAKYSRKLAADRRDGDFLDRLLADATKRETHAYKHAEKRSSDPECTFQPSINKSSQQLRARTVDELSRGDHEHNLDLKMQAEQQSHDQVKNQFQFKPRLNHGSKAIAGRLMLNTKDGRETYLNRIKEADEDLNQAIAEHRARQHDKELSECTFKPEIRDAPQYVKRIASSMKLNKATKPAQSKTTYSFLSAVSHD